MTALWRRLSRSHVRTAISMTLGASVGAAYAHFVGCHTGTCLITSTVWGSSLFGGAVGAVLGWPTRAASARAGTAEERG